MYTAPDHKHKGVGVNILERQRRSLPVTVVGFVAVVATLLTAGCGLFSKDSQDGGDPLERPGFSDITDKQYDQALASGALATLTNNGYRPTLVYHPPNSVRYFLQMQLCGNGVDRKACFRSVLPTATEPWVEIQLAEPPRAELKFEGQDGFLLVYAPLKVGDWLSCSGILLDTDPTWPSSSASASLSADASPSPSWPNADAGPSSPSAGSSPSTDAGEPIVPADVADNLAIIGNAVRAMQFDVSGQGMTATSYPLAIWSCAGIPSSDG
jgi:hypothetical protein